MSTGNAWRLHTSWCLGRGKLGLGNSQLLHAFLKLLRLAALTGMDTEHGSGQQGFEATFILQSLQRFTK